MSGIHLEVLFDILAISVIVSILFIFILLQGYRIGHDLPCYPDLAVKLPIPQSGILLFYGTGSVRICQVPVRPFSFYRYVFQVLF